MELLVQFDRIVFLGKANSQLPAFLDEAATLRQGRPWLRVDVFSLADFTDNGRPGCTRLRLERERDQAELQLRAILARHSHAHALYRYEYQGFYGSLWQHEESGSRRVHTSARVPGLDIRYTPGTVLVELPGMPSQVVEHYFDLAEKLIADTPPLEEPAMSRPSEYTDLLVSARHAAPGLESAAHEKSTELTPAQQAALARIAARLKEETTDPDVLCAVDDRMVSLFQAWVEDQAEARGLETEEVQAGGREVKFDERDAGWATSLFSWVGGLKKAAWRTPPEVAEPLVDGARIAMLGDWGSGLYAAPVISQTITADPGRFDLLVHLGDVYYAGTRKAVRERFLAHWPERADAVSRACNANHEMYPGGHGFFDDVLGAFAQSASPFALQSRHFLLVGLDTAYDDNDLAGEQAEWLTRLVGRADDRRLVLMSHHNPWSLFEKAGHKVVARLEPLLRSGRVFAWYWGHEHRCVVYDQHPDWKLWGRCIGHSGFPYFRKALHGAELSQVEGHRWVRVAGPDGGPDGLVLDGPNRYVPGKEERYGPQGYLTIELHGPTLVERVHAPTGEVLLVQTLA